MRPDGCWWSAQNMKRPEATDGGFRSFLPDSRFGRRQCDKASPLEREIRFQLNQSRRCIATEEGAKDRRRRIDRAENDPITARSVLRVNLWLREVGMVEYIEELGSHLQARGFPFRYPEALNKIQIRIGV